MRPAPEVADGTFLQSDFAANLQQVKDGTAPPVYGHPLEFFRRTHLTAGMRRLLAAAARRLSGNGGNPIIQTKSGFGGGKTHSLIALYHLATGCDQLLGRDGDSGPGRVAAELAPVLEEAGVRTSRVFAAKAAVLHGGWLSPNSARATPAGDPLNTLWGEMAWQLAGQAGYDALGESARSGVAPGGEDLDRLLKLAGPCVILVDEIVNYARNDDLDRVGTFLHNLTEALMHQPTAVLVVSLPVSDYEAGGERGVRALAVLENILGRTQSVLEIGPSGEDEAHAVVKRRLFEDAVDPEAVGETCLAYSRMYQRYPDQFPEHVRTPRYLEWMRQCYPVHPEVFDRLFRDWSEFPEFQRTRGVLRLMARSVSLASEGGESPALLMPADLRFSDPHVGQEFLRLLGPEWGPAMSEVDGEHSSAHAIDRRRPARYGAVGGAAARVSRALFLGSSPRSTPRGLESRQVNLDVASPGHGLSVYTDALDEMEERLHHLYRSADGRYFFDSKGNLNREATERAASFSIPELDAEIIRRLEQLRQTQDLLQVVIAPHTPAEVPDKDRVALVVLPPDSTLPTRTAEKDEATEAVRSVLSFSGEGIGRVWSNTLLFLAARRDGVRELRSAASLYLAWDAMLGDPGVLRDSSRRQEAAAKRTSAGEAVQRALINAYRWALAPLQSDPLRAQEYDLDRWQQVPRNPMLLQAVVDHLADGDHLIVSNLQPAHLLRAVKEHLWIDQPGPHHGGIADLWSALNRHVYMGLRFVGRDPFDRCLEQGIRHGTFAYAEGYNAHEGTYVGLRWRDSGDGPLTVAEHGLLVSPEAAEQSLRRRRTGINGVVPVPSAQTGEDSQPAPALAPANGRPTRIVARKTFSADATAFDLNLLRDEIALNLAHDGGEVTIEVTITGVKAGGFSQGAAGSVAENSDALGVDLDDDSTPPG